MWSWDQGHLEYFQFDSLRHLAEFSLVGNFMAADRATLIAATGLAFSAPATHSPWRNYGRALKLALLVSENKGHAEPTPIAMILAQPGATTCDEYMHFLAQVFTDSPPALSAYNPTANLRWPLLFSLKFLLARVAIGNQNPVDIDEIIGAYRRTGFDGSEDDTAFIGIVGSALNLPAASGVNANLLRQARESIRVLSQISYLTCSGSKLAVALNEEDARDIFQDLNPVTGPRKVDRNAEISRLAALYAGGSIHSFFDYSKSVINEVVESGFSEGDKVKKTHVVIERNRKLRDSFFTTRPTAVCDVCSVHTAKTYSVPDRILDLHHLLPLSSGTRASSSGTSLDDLVPVCPTCHRAIHRFYDSWLKGVSQKDFKDRNEARAAYAKMKSGFGGFQYA